MAPPEVVAVKVTDVPEQTGVDGLAAAMADKATPADTVTLPVAEHPAALLAITV